MDYTYREIQKGTEKRKRRREESGRKRETNNTRKEWRQDCNNKDDMW